MKNKAKPVIFYGWILVAVSFLIVLVSYGMRYSFSVFFVAIIDEFGWSRASTSGIFSLNLAIYGLSAAIVGTLVDKLGPRKLVPLGAFILALGLVALSRANAMWHFYLFFGLLVAFGNSSIGVAPHIPIISHWFIRRRGAAIGIFFAGVAGAPIMVPLAHYLISGLGWRTAYLALAALAILIIVPLAALFLRHRPEDMGLLPDGLTTTTAGEGSQGTGGQLHDALVIDKEWASTEWTLPKAMRTYRFWALFLAQLSVGVYINLLFLHQVAHAVDVGYSEALAASILGLVGLMSLIGNLGGFISDRLGREHTYTLGAIGAIAAVIALTLTRDTTLPFLLYFYAICFGLCSGLGTPPLMASGADLFQGKNFGSINGFIVMAFGIGGFIGPLVGGYIFDVTGSYTLAFGLTTILIATSCIFLWLAAPRKVRLVAGKAARAVSAR